MKTLFAKYALLLSAIALLPACDHVTDISELVLRQARSAAPANMDDRRPRVDYSGFDGATFRGISWARPIADCAAFEWNSQAVCYLAAGVWLNERGELGSVKDCPEWQFEYFAGDGRLLTVWVDWGGAATSKGWGTQGRFFRELPRYTDGQVEAWMRTAATDFKRLAGERSFHYQLFLWSLDSNRHGQLQFYVGRDPERMLGYVTFDLDSGWILERFQE